MRRWISSWVLGVAGNLWVGTAAVVAAPAVDGTAAAAAKAAATSATTAATTAAATSATAAAISAATTTATTASAQAVGAHADAAIAPPLSDTVRTMAAKVLALADHQGLPFAVVDKLGAQLAVFHADGRLAGVSTALLGQTPGDDSVPGVGLRTQSGQLRADDRTTPAGRFVSTPGRNHKGEAVVWVDFNAAFAIHRLRADPAEAARAARMASSNPRDKRASAGCVVVPVAFYQQVVQAVLGRGPAVVYVMPESRPWQTVFATRGARAAL